MVTLTEEDPLPSRWFAGGRADGPTQPGQLPHPNALALALAEQRLLLAEAAPTPAPQGAGTLRRGHHQGRRHDRNQQQQAAAAAGGAAEAEEASSTTTAAAAAEAVSNLFVPVPNYEPPSEEQADAIMAAVEVRWGWWCAACSVRQ